MSGRRRLLARNSAGSKHLFTFLSSDHHRQETSLLLLFRRALAFRRAWGTGDQIRERSVVEDVGCGVAHIEKDLVERAVREVAVDEHTQLLGVGERRQGAIDEAHYLAQTNLSRIATQLVATLGSAHAFHHAGVFEFEQDQFQELLWKIFFIGNFTNLDGTLMVMPRQHHHGLEGVESLL